ncbi:MULTISPECIES: hypothetical protein [Thermoactinomyces]|uniref:Uncharacterized protein n=2 Tax=Thermoactinomyces TaxID=2023 RepID=A0A8I1DGU5_THEIN|nr:MULTISPECIES: hypothetical protein [Thermoactinomyces]KFZ39991.1 hypothetical protein JS81_10620 [Thermoactinomyces sp. Gus2-1]MBA4549922.1 hypothetical protein [Thermoactinomyces intermedius]MBA4551193.1 hypothetical protein [Thermoactinomyces vulgaris]MBA4596848.1 hypothetical protein [Thermoactinomyces vulgaris]MBA4835651.1 hypothetical protein [Thermoactinomyces intermedius]
MKTADAFLKGYKPAFLEILGLKQTTKHLNFLLANYPHVSHRDYDLLSGNRFYLFFQTDFMRHRFEEELKQSTFSLADTDRILGMTLGFPPRAVGFYVQMMREKRKGNTQAYQQMKSRKIGMIYSGCSFASDIADFKENALWLLKRYPYEEAKEDGMYIRIGLEPRIPVPVDDYQGLTEFHEYIMKKSGFVTV